MNKKLLAALLSLCCLCASAFGIAGCSSEHEHTYSSDWRTNATQHWHAATCGHTDEKSDLADHTYGEGTVTTAATCTTAGVKTYTCTVCGYKKTEEIPALGHDYDYDKITWSWSDSTTEAEATATVICKNDSTHTYNPTVQYTQTSVDATCTTAGSVTYTAYVIDEENVKHEFNTPKTINGVALGHDYDYANANVVWDTSEDEDEEPTVTATITVTCTHEGCNETEIIDGDDIEITSATTATCQEDGVKTYTAKFTVNGTTYTCSNTYTEEIAALGHSYGKWVAGVAATCESTGTKGHYECSVCHKYFDADKNEITDLTIAAGHDYNYDNITWSWSDSTTEAVATATVTCKNDSTHTYNPTVQYTQTSADATCTTAGSVTYTAYVIDEENVKHEFNTTKTINGVALGHDYDYENASVVWGTSEDEDKEPTVTATITVSCTREGCDETLIIDGDDITITSATTATCIADGVKTYTATFTVDGTTYTCSDTHTEADEASPAYHTYAYNEESKTVACTVCGNVLCKSGNYVVKASATGGVSYDVTINAEKMTIDAKSTAYGPLLYGKFAVAVSDTYGTPGAYATFVYNSLTYYLKYDSEKDVYIFGYGVTDSDTGETISYKYTAEPAVENFNLALSDFVGVYTCGLETGDFTEKDYTAITVDKISVYYATTLQIVVTMTQNGNTFTQVAEHCSGEVDASNRISAFCTSLGYFYIEAVDKDANSFSFYTATYPDKIGALTKTDETPTALPTSISGVADGTYTASNSSSEPPQIKVTGGKVYIYATAGATIIGTTDDGGYKLSDCDSNYDPCEYILKVVSGTLELYNADGTLIDSYAVPAADTYPELTAGEHYECVDTASAGRWVYSITSSGTYKITAESWGDPFTVGISSDPSIDPETTYSIASGGSKTLTLTAGQYVVITAEGGRVPFFIVKIS